ncbi:alpha/beta fold hydrolase [Pseudorhodobacter sp.]|uniref:alpha/beta fold hydrolase n=1 Tax=Pseudorhodobacter sp. TaxID=1934400 RepID=UPI002648B05F|nr:alpha/beta fold hydrolase [Pseudorhodobacter sp.]MDN5788522.1 alpha/beta hydrolase [Pseudorhodobacter sp.]
MNDPLILIPGLMSDARLFGAQIIDLSRSRAVMVALPHPGATIEEISAHVLASAPARFALAGLGLGAHVALDLMRRDMARVSRVALLSADPLGESPDAAAAREKRMILARTGRLSQAMAEDMPSRALADSDRADEIMTLVEDMAFALGPDVFVAQSRALQRRRDQQKTLRRAQIPALVLAGAKDSLVPLRRQAFMAELMPSARVQIIENAGHLLPLEQPDAVTRALAMFFDGPLVLS